MTSKEWNKRNIREFLEEKLEEVPELPCRVDEMTPREYAIFSTSAQLIGALQFLVQELADSLGEKRTVLIRSKGSDKTYNVLHNCTATLRGLVARLGALQRRYLAPTKKPVQQDLVDTLGLVVPEVSEVRDALGNLLAGLLGAQKGTPTEIRISLSPDDLRRLRAGEIISPEAVGFTPAVLVTLLLEGGRED